MKKHLKKSINLIKKFKKEKNGKTDNITREKVIYIGFSFYYSNSNIDDINYKNKI